jgi:NADH dehydrogenase [ubiquinone] 1 alpha subcomplex assembly factor 7
MIPAIAGRIAADGPLPLARARALAADHYYATREPFGRAGDFVTAPEISQMFGELVGLWLADIWARSGAPEPFILAELGPGRGTLLDDALRAAGHALPAFAAAARLHLVERSPRLRALQAARFTDATFHESIETIPAGPLLIVANEFFDALPISQFVRTAHGWAMRAVGAAGWDESVPANRHFIPEALQDAPVGAIYERSFAGEALAAAIARRLAHDGGAAFISDYGYAGPALGDTVQAIHASAFADVVVTLGEADISAHVDFAALAAAARPHARVAGPVDQGQFLMAIGIRARADRLKAAADLPTRAAIEAALARLVAPGAMGRLFKAMAIMAPGWAAPAGFPA